jgi:hypothetical protein
MTAVGARQGCSELGAGAWHGQCEWALSDGAHPTKNNEVLRGARTMETQPHNDTIDDLKKTLNELRTMTDEIRVQLHLAGMDAKDKWTRDLEPRLYSLEKRVEAELSTASKVAAADLRDAFRTFRDSLKKL